MLIASTESRIHSNLLFLMADIMEMLMTDVREMFRAEGFELKHEAKRNFNTALKALKNLRHGCIETCSMSTQEDFANDADNMYETIKLIIDRCGENDDKLFRFYEYIKSFPSEWRRKLIKSLHLMQKWRRGGGDMPLSPKDFGLAIDECIRLLRSMDDKLFNELMYGKDLIPTEITKVLLIKNGYKEMVYGDYCEYVKEVEGFWLSFKYDMSNTPNRDWYLHVDSSERCIVAGCDVQYVHQAQQLMEIFDVKLEFHV